MPRGSWSISTLMPVLPLAAGFSPTAYGASFIDEGALGSNSIDDQRSTLRKWRPLASVTLSCYARGQVVEITDFINITCTFTTRLRSRD